MILRNMKLLSVKTAGDLYDTMCPYVLFLQFHKNNMHTQTNMRKFRKKFKILLMPNSEWVKR